MKIVIKYERQPILSTNPDSFFFLIKFDILFGFSQIAPIKSSNILKLFRARNCASFFDRNLIVITLDLVEKVTFFFSKRYTTSLRMKVIFRDTSIVKKKMTQLLKSE
jgi:hypothetical protein